VLDTRETGASARQKGDSRHPDLAQCETPALGAGLACSGQSLPLGVGGQHATRPASTTSIREYGSVRRSYGN
jgi:hypothetical protein